MRLFSSRRLANAPWVQKTIGVAAAEYLRFVYATSHFERVPADIYAILDRESPVIFALWHGQHFMAPLGKLDKHRIKVLVSRHRDGEINAVAAERLGVGTIRGSGDHGYEFNRKGGVSAFRGMLDALEEGYSVALTADVPKVSRVCGLGIIKLASYSGRKIFPLAVATHRRIQLDNWDRTAINLPFSRGAGVIAAPISVPHDADDHQLEAARLAVEKSLNEATERAYAIVDRKNGGSGG